MFGFLGFRAVGLVWGFEVFRPRWARCVGQRDIVATTGSMASAPGRAQGRRRRCCPALPVEFRAYRVYRVYRVYCV